MDTRIQSNPNPNVALPVARFPNVEYAHTPDKDWLYASCGVVLVTTGFASTGIGVVAGLIDLGFHPVFLFPGMMGLAVGMVTAGFVVIGRLHSRLAAGTIGLCGGCLAYVVMHFIGYVLERHRFSAGMSFLQYIDAVARGGLTVSPPLGANVEPIKLGHIGSYIYWFLEIAIVASTAAWLPISWAGQPFCKVCEKWKTFRVGSFVLGREDAIAHFESGELLRLADPREPSGENPIGLTVWWCPHCQEHAPVDARLSQSVLNTKGVKETELGFRTFPGAALPVFQSLCALCDDPNIPPAIRRCPAPLGGEERKRFPEE
jgi:hypothetical protein